YNTLYADVERWATEEGFVDYICPQIYFGFYNEVQPFTRTAKDWAELTTSCRLYVGLALYKSGQEDKFASSDQSYAINEFIDNHNIISRQISYLQQLEKVGGYYIFSYSYLIDKENQSVMEEVKNIKDVI
ncbi:MAG: family 10 glycosylhydrolase, partial [Eubacterium sp.]|nr:family 10 glycosylhydrolase [Eubacterium sp.]